MENSEKYIVQSVPGKTLYGLLWLLLRKCRLVPGAALYVMAEEQPSLISTKRLET